MKRIAFVVLGIVLLVALIAVAQGVTLGLSADDFALLSAANGAALDSFAFDYTLKLAESLDTFAISADLSGSGVVDRTAPSLSTTVSGQITLGNTQTIPLDAEVRLIGSILSLNTGEGWQALEDAPTALADRIAEYTGLSADTERLARWDLYGIDGLDDFLTPLAAADPISFLSAERLADESVGGAQAAHFQMTADLHALFGSDAFVDAIVALSQAQGSDLIIRTRDEVAEILRAHSQAADPATLTIETYIGLDDRTIRRIVARLDMQIAPIEAGYSSPPFTVNAIFDAVLSDHNQPQTIAAPDGAAAVSQFNIPIPPPESPGEGTAQYVFFGTLEENAVYTQMLDLQAGDIVTVTARRLALEFDPLIRLLSADGDTLLENDDHETTPFLASAYDSQFFNFAIPEAGTYSVQVTDAFGGAGGFVLTINVER